MIWTITGIIKDSSGFISAKPQKVHILNTCEIVYKIDMFEFLDLIITNVALSHI